MIQRFRKQLPLLSLLLSIALFPVNGFAQAVLDGTVYTGDEAGPALKALRVDAPAEAESDGDFVQLTTDSTRRLRVASGATGSNEPGGSFGVGLRPVLVVADTAEALSTATVLVVTAHAARVGDIIEFTAGTAGNIGAWSSVCDTDTNSITLCTALPATPAAADAFNILRPRPHSPLYNEDTAHTSGDVGELALGVVTTSASASFSATNLDHVPFAVDANTGSQLVTLRRSGYSTDPLRPEDDPLATAESGIVVLFQNERSISVDQGSDADAAYPKVDRLGRVLTTQIPDAHLFSCVSAADITDTNAAAVCAADADELYVITDICCSNTDTAVSTRVNILDDATVVHTMVLSSNVVAAPGDANSCQTFPNGIKAAAINKAINAQNVTNSAEVRCSIHGYKLPS